MILLIDAGNTRSKVCVLEADGISEARALDEAVLNRARGGQAFISCVANSQTKQQLADQLAAYAIEAEWLVSPAQGLGLKNSYPMPEKLGVDRFLALAAAYSKAGQACLVIDAGTAITVDVCDDEGQHLGGMIAPGLLPLSRALRNNTELPWVEPDQLPTEAFANNTEQALQLGALKSAVGLLEHAYKLARKAHPDCVFYLTGGAAPFLAPYLDMPVEIEPKLVFFGIELFARRNAS